MVKSHVGVDPGWEDQVARLYCPSGYEANEKFILAKARAHWSKVVVMLGNPVGMTPH